MMSYSLTPIKSIHRQISNLLKVDCLVAGGCIRDYLCDKNSYKDIDLFIPCIDKASYLRYFQSLSHHFSTKNLSKDDYTEDITNIINVRETTVRFGTPLQFIFFRKETDNFCNDVFSTFDFGINCCGLDSSGILTSNLFETDRDTKSFTIHKVFSGKQLLKTVKKYERLRDEKYQDFHLEYYKDALK